MRYEELDVIEQQKEVVDDRSGYEYSIVFNEPCNKVITPNSYITSIVISHVDVVLRLASDFTGDIIFNQPGTVVMANGVYINGSIFASMDSYVVYHNNDEYVFGHVGLEGIVEITGEIGEYINVIDY